MISSPNCLRTSRVETASSSASGRSLRLVALLAWIKALATSAEQDDTPSSVLAGQEDEPGELISGPHDGPQQPESLLSVSLSLSLSLSSVLRSTSRSIAVRMSVAFDGSRPLLRLLASLMPLVGLGPAIALAPKLMNAWPNGKRLRSGEVARRACNVSISPYSSASLYAGFVSICASPTHRASKLLKDLDEPFKETGDRHSPMSKS
jgi:hypothetical protein